MTGPDRFSTYRLRAARPDDYGDIVELWRACGLKFSACGRESESAFRAQLDRFPDLYLVATEDDSIIGVVLGSHDCRKGWINRVAVLANCRRRGIAAVLIEACDAAIRAHGIEIVSVLIEEGNEASAGLFKKLGYRDDVPARYYRKLSHPDA